MARLLTLRGVAITCGIALAWFAQPAVADTVRVAVASNFAKVAKQLSADFEATRDDEIIMSIGATGKHFAQIINGAPFDVFLAADRERPERLEANGHSVPGTRFTYAFGELAAWAPGGTEMPFPDALLEAASNRIAIANPRLAPYGRAARETLQALGSWQRLQGRIVRGENVGQALQFVHSGNAAIGLIARAQLVALGSSATGTSWIVPTSLYAPIEQQAVLLKDRPASRGFIDYLQSESARRLIREAGYILP